MTRPQIVVAGTGKMARDVGAYFLARGHPVAWLSRAPERLEVVERWVRRRLKRLAREAGEAGGAPPGVATFHLVGSRDVPRAELFVECINEAEEDKRALLAAVDEVVPVEALRVSNSSSISPDALHSECAGLHFFYPVELTGFVEAVFPKGFGAARRRRLRELLDSLDLECIEEEPAAAFAVNRLLLPVQAEAMRWVQDGASPRLVDAACVSVALPVGQLALMDTIGLDVVQPAVCNFASRLGAEVARCYAPLCDGLTRLVADGKRGRKNGDGLLEGRPLPWTGAGDVAPPPWLAERLRCLFANACEHAVEHGLLRGDQLALALAALFDFHGGLAELLAPLDPGGAARVLDAAWRETGRLYFVPAGALRVAAAGAAPARGGWPEHGLLL